MNDWKHLNETRPVDYTIAVKSTGRVELWAWGHPKARLCYKHPRVELYLWVHRNARVTAERLEHLDRYAVAFVAAHYGEEHLIRRVNSKRGEVISW